MKKYSNYTDEIINIFSDMLNTANTMIRVHKEAREIIKDQLFNRKPVRQYSNAAKDIVEEIREKCGFNEVEKISEYFDTIFVENESRYSFMMEWEDIWYHNDFMEFLPDNYLRSPDKELEAYKALIRILFNLQWGTASVDLPEEYYEIFTDDALEVIKDHIEYEMGIYTAAQKYFDCVDELHKYLKDSYYELQCLYKIRDAFANSLRRNL